MSRYPKSLDNMLAIWNSDDPDEVRRLTQENLETNVHFVDPNYNIIGQNAFIDMVFAVQSKIPGAVYSRASRVDSHHNHYRYHWAIHMGDELIMPGFDVTEVNDSGKIVKITGFFGRLDRSEDE